MRDPFGDRPVCVSVCVYVSESEFLGENIIRVKT